MAQRALGRVGISLVAGSESIMQRAHIARVVYTQARLAEDLEAPAA
jgi:hypothetical protein